MLIPVFYAIIIMMNCGQAGPALIQAAERTEALNPYSLTANLGEPKQCAADKTKAIIAI
jgi:hypothetical protein